MKTVTKITTKQESSSHQNGKTRIGRKPIDSDAEYSAVLQSTKNNTANIPKYLQTLLEGDGVGIDENQPYPFPKPDWLDMEKLRRGQKFAMNNIFSVMFSTLITIVFSFTSREMLKPLIFTGNSSTPFTSFKRYLSTVTRVRTWYAGDMWQAGDEAHKNMKTVRGRHQSIKKKLVTTPEEEITRKETNVGQPMWTDLHQELLEDFKESCPPLEIPIVGPKQVHVSQSHMAITQFGFIGLFILYPKMFGVHNASKEDLEAFAHLWRGIGYLLGIEDRYNLCTGTIEEVHQKCRDVLDFWLIPLLRYISIDWVHMVRCMSEGFSYYTEGTTFEGIIMYLCTVINVDTPRLARALNFKQKCFYHFMVFLMKYMMRVPGVRLFFNWSSTKGVEKTRNIPPEKMKELEGRVYPYETQGMCPMMG